MSSPLAPPVVLCVIPGPAKVLKIENDGVRWCFGCRVRLSHTRVLCDYDYDLGNVDTYPYYDPVWVRRCSRCGRDKTRFPST